MRTKKATEHFKGLNGVKRMNCAESVAIAFEDHCLLSENEFLELKGCGGGKSPSGYCGSLHAALLLMDKKYPDKAEELKDAFGKYSGSLICKEIRASKKVTCLDTIIMAVDHVNNCFCSY